MNRIEIYRDDKILVEIDEMLQYFIDNIFIRAVKLSKYQYNILLKLAVDELYKNGFNCTKSQLHSSSNVPIIEENKTINLIDTFKVLETAFYCLSLINNEEVDVDETIQTLKDYYEEEEIPFYIKFYKESTYNVDGFVVARDKDNLLISFFSLSNRENL